MAAELNKPGEIEVVKFEFRCARYVTPSVSIGIPTSMTASAEKIAGIPMWDIAVSQKGGILRGPVRLLTADRKITSHADSATILICFNAPKTEAPP